MQKRRAAIKSLELNVDRAFDFFSGFTEAKCRARRARAITLKQTCQLVDKASKDIPNIQKLFNKNKNKSLY